MSVVPRLVHSLFSSPAPILVHPLFSSPAPSLVHPLFSSLTPRLIHSLFSSPAPRLVHSLPYLQCHRAWFSFYLVFSVTTLITASIIATIQKRVTIFGSAYPFF
ncbi:MAG TPA: hypothetical protein PKE28_11290 [Bacteroidales bacterium]|nr:hypothetical protein [Bacteroidales bacterium]